MTVSCEDYVQLSCFAMKETRCKKNSKEFTPITITVIIISNAKITENRHVYKDNGDSQ